MQLLAMLRTQARANRLANRRLHDAMRGLSDAEFGAPRVGYFPSLAATLNHILAVDLYYLAGLHREPDMLRRFEEAPVHAGIGALADAQAHADERFIAHLDRIGPGDFDEVIALDRGDHVQRERRGHVVAHLLAHQVHHRGQAHAMLSGTCVAPPQLDEFLMPGEAALRTADLAALGWTEATLFGASTDA